MNVIAFFNNDGGMGKAALVYNLAWMLAEIGLKVLAADLDPQSNLSKLCLEDARLLELWPKGKHPLTLLAAVDGFSQEVHVEPIADRVGLIPGDLGLSRYEGKYAEAWVKYSAGDETVFRTITAFSRIVRVTGEQWGADIVLVDLGPNLGGINRSALIAAQHLVVPLTPDLFAVQALRTVGPQLRTWSEGLGTLHSPANLMRPAGYVIMQDTTRSDRPARAYLHWIDKIPSEYREWVVGQEPSDSLRVAEDPYCLASLKNYRSLAPLAIHARKPMFFLKPADGAVGAHGEAVRDCYKEFKTLAERIVSSLS